ncbi:MAG TPA: ABC transporter ATP-binding protein [Xanthobacteraceae bacterium]|nr:ABC transporter ATP-binding protein [Xanthobacteraceae bacterium]
MAALALRGIGKRFGETLAVDDLSIEVADGEFVVLLGPSGCGKTTTLRMIAGFLETTAGTVRIGQRDVTREPPHRRNVGFVFQNYALFPHLDVAENVAFGLRRRHLPETEIGERLRRALALVKLEGFEARMPRELSGGQQQRVAIARALVIAPDVLLLDEPLSNLDAKLRRDVRQDLRRLQKLSGITTVMVTHDQDEAMSIGDRLAVMNAGRVQQIGTPQALYRHPANRFVAGFIGRGNFFDGTPAADGRSFVTRSGLTIACERIDGGADTLLVRPENVAVRRGQGSGPNCYPARIEAAIFQGSSFDLDLRLAGGDAIEAQVPAPDGRTGDWAAGEDVAVEIDPAAAVGIASGA